jgi:hypothetical protein
MEETLVLNYGQLWRNHAGTPFLRRALTTRAIPGSHVSIFTEPDVRDLAATIGDELRKLD